MTDLTRQAFEQARWLEDGWVGPEHFLLALLAEASVATEALGEVGVTYDEFLERMRNRRGDPDWPSPRYDPAKGLTGPNPAGHQLMGRAEGFAAAWGHRWPAPEHWLLAMLYADHQLGPLLHEHDASPQDLLDALRRRGVPLPEVDPPEYRPWRGHHRIEVTEAELQPVIDVLTQRHPQGSAWRWGFNWLPGQPRRARVDAEEGIDLDGILAKVRAQASS